MLRAFAGRKEAGELRARSRAFPTRASCCVRPRASATRSLRKNVNRRLCRRARGRQEKKSLASPRRYRAQMQGMKQGKQKSASSSTGPRASSRSARSAHIGLRDRRAGQQNETGKARELERLSKTRVGSRKRSRGDAAAVKLNEAVLNVEHAASCLEQSARRARDGGATNPRQAVGKLRAVAPAAQSSACARRVCARASRRIGGLEPISGLSWSTSARSRNSSACTRHTYPHDQLRCGKGGG